jgi:murein DD-endopeptidase MepM/ murein hydrolase activator NlpD
MSRHPLDTSVLTYLPLRGKGIGLFARLVLALSIFYIPLNAPPAQLQDTLILTPTTQGVFHLPETGLTLEIGYASVNDTTRLSVTRSGAAVTLQAWDASGAPLARFEMPLIATLPGGAAPLLVGWPGTVDPSAAPTDTGDPLAGIWLVVFDAHGIYARPAWDAATDSILYLGPLEHFTPDLVEQTLTIGGITFAESPPVERSILRTGSDTGTTALPTAARAARYRDRFIPEDLGNPGGFMLLGWAHERNLPDVARALRATIPDDPDLPAPGVPQAPLRLILPFDCAANWVVSWGYHHSTPQNRFAVDFAVEAPGSAAGQPVYAAHTGTVYLKRYGTPERLIDVGLSARVVAQDGITSTVYGHLDPPGTFARWGIDGGDLPDFEWVELGTVAQGQVIGVAGRTGYATGPHIHFALWSWDQSLYQPVPLGPLTVFERGLRIPGDLRASCEVYGW